MSNLLGDKAWDLFHGDAIPHMLKDMPESSVDFSIYSPPFPSLYAYSDAVGDIGNVDSVGAEARIHLSFMYAGLMRVLRPGRVAVVHVCQIPRMKRSGGVGLCDFRGMNIRLGERAGLTYEYDWTVRKNPQAQSIRGKVWALGFGGLESDRCGQRGALNDYLIKFRKPGGNSVPVNADGQVSRDDWKLYAEGCWDDIQETDTLNTKAAKSDEDTRHICPLQLETIRRCVLLFSDPGELVFSPFAGIGSEGFISLGGKSPKTGKRIIDARKFYGCELKPEYYEQACKNLQKAESQLSETNNESLFDFASLES